MFLTLILLNLWRLSETNSVSYWISMIIAFGMIGWCWEK